MAFIFKRTPGLRSIKYFGFQFFATWANQQHHKSSPCGMGWWFDGSVRTQQFWWGIINKNNISTCFGKPWWGGAYVPCMPHVWPISECFMLGWSDGTWPACCHWPNTGKVDGRCPIMSVLVQSLSRVRDFWFGFDGICAFTIVMGIFVLLCFFQELVIAILWKCFCVSILFCHQIMSWFHTWAIA